MDPNTTEIDEHLEFIERHFFHEFTEAYEKYQDGYPNYDEVLAYERALETITTIREEFTEGRTERVKRTAAIVAEELDNIDDDSDAEPSLT